MSLIAAAAVWLVAAATLLAIAALLLSEPAAAQGTGSAPQPLATKVASTRTSHCHQVPLSIGRTQTS